MNKPEQSNKKKSNKRNWQLKTINFLDILIGRLLNFINFKIFIYLKEICKYIFLWTIKG